VEISKAQITQEEEKILLESSQTCLGGKSSRTSCVYPAGVQLRPAYHARVTDDCLLLLGPKTVGSVPIE
jgi:hypothetical protein